MRIRIEERDSVYELAVDAEDSDGYIESDDPEWIVSVGIDIMEVVTSIDCMKQ